MPPAVAMPSMIRVTVFAAGSGGVIPNRSPRIDAAAGQHSNETEDRPDPHDCCHVAHDETQHVPRCRPDRQAHCHFVSTKRHEKCEQAVETDCCEGDRRDTERGQPPRAEAARGNLVVDEHVKWPPTLGAVFAHHAKWPGTYACGTWQMSTDA